MLFCALHKSPVGNLQICATEKGICSIKFLFNATCYGKEHLHPFVEDAKHYLNAFFAKEKPQWNLPLDLKGTAFQLKVWDALRQIPFGETRTYQQIAIAVGNPKAARAVGRANHYNPIPIIVPCHRVIGANGKLVGYASGLSLKQQLLDFERFN